ncbi:MAG: hypothetical protein KDJ88_21975 [Bauldia sp.]|nr:hypothetical protein [Bauldia sp.]
MNRIQTNAQDADGTTDYDHYRSMAQELRAKALANMFGTARVVIFNAARVPFHRNRAA